MGVKVVLMSNKIMKKSYVRKKEKKQESTLKVCPHCRWMSLVNEKQEYCPKCGLTINENFTDKVLNFMGGSYGAFVIIALLINYINHDYPDVGGYFTAYILIACIIFMIIHNYSKTHAEL